MIRRVSADQEGFKTVYLQPGFNVVLADRTQGASNKDSRNGLGKSLLIDIIHFCLGSEPGPGDVLRQEPLRNWTFELELDLRDRTYLVRRNTDTPGKVYVYGDSSDWPIRTRVDKDTGEPAMTRDEWTRLLGWAMFGLSSDRPTEKYVPTFRSLISYFARRDLGAYLDPFKQHPNQQEWDKQVNGAFLLGLNWEHAQRWQQLKDRENEIKQLNRAIKTGLATEFLGSLGSLETARIRLDREIKREQADLDSFRVHPEYQAVEEEANRLTFAIRDLTNANVVDQGMLELYRQSLAAEKPADDRLVAEVFAEAGVVLSGQVVKRLDEVHEFHRQVVGNRRAFLEGEIGRLRAGIAQRERDVARLTEQRASLLEILRSHGALDEYMRLQQRLGAKVAELGTLDRRIELWQRLEREQSSVKIEKEGLRLDARADLEERKNEREEAIDLFNDNSEALYDAPGELIIDLKDTGFKFDVEIERSGSEGINRMKVFCFDLMLAQRWASRLWSPGFLIHDSVIYDGVDERQRARALQLAARESATRGFQYLCCLNSDMVPYGDFDSVFDFHQYQRLILTDATEDGGLLGMRF
jgi:uncharacterized protein YydD (DUF2326 family)